MSCKKCKKSSCSGNCEQSSIGKNIAELKNLVSELTSNLQQVTKDTAFLKCGHPILMLQNAIDISFFSFNSGLGSKKWEGWAICNGATQQDSCTGEDFELPNLLNRFPVGAGDEYDVDDTGGFDDVALIIPELPVHNHGITDPMHSHDITDPGHNHGAAGGTHTHSFTANPHTHVVGPDGAHEHYLQTAVFSIGDNGGTGPFGPAVGALTTGTNYGPPLGGLFTAIDGVHSHTPANTTVTGAIGNSSASVTVSNAFIGITETEVHETNITINDAGEGNPHENRPPYYALLFVMKL